MNSRTSLLSIEPAIVAPHPWARETVLESGDEYFRALFAAMDEARETINLETYIFEDGPLGAAVLERLERAVVRGVRVRLIVDGVGAPSFNRGKVAALASRGIQVRVYHPLPWIWFSFSGFFGLLFKLNRRDHRKLCLIDGECAWTGSMNVSSDHLSSLLGAREKPAWRDTGARVQGPEVHELSRAFDRTWMRATGLSRRNLRWAPPQWRRFKNRSARVRLNASRAARRHYYRDLLKRISGAKRRVWITNAYFAPDILLVRALRVAAWAGADVRVLVPRKSDVFFMPWVSEAFYHHLLRAGVRVHEYLPTILHSKTMLIDDWATVGSSNLNHRSLLHDLEIDVVLEHPESVTTLTRRFEEDLASSREISLAQWKGLPLPQRIAAKILLFFRYFI